MTGGWGINYLNPPMHKGSGSGVNGQYAGRGAPGQPLTERHGLPSHAGCSKCCTPASLAKGGSGQSPGATAYLIDITSPTRCNGLDINSAVSLSVSTTYVILHHYTYPVPFHSCFSRHALLLSCHVRLTQDPLPRQLS